MLRNIEAKIESLFEGVFGRAFRTNVQPVELARKLVKEMEDNRVISVSRLYVPNEYTIYLSPADREQFENYEESLVGELQDYLAENARREKYVLLSPPQVAFETDEDLDVGEFGIATRMAQGGRQVTPSEMPAAPAAPGATMVYKPKQPETEAVSPAELGLERELVTLNYGGRSYPLEKRRVVIGRSKDCDIEVADPNVSRRHAEVRQEGSAHWVVDLGSTNGTEVNGRRLKRAKLRPGDTITVGSSELVFGREPES
ncbi:MAG TPA: DUF3662 and FHA domain-containing protein [Gaiellaceae bacterium]